MKILNIFFIACLLVLFLISCEKDNNIPSASVTTVHAVSMTVSPDTLVLPSTKSDTATDVTTLIEFNLPEAAHVKLVLYDDINRLVATLLDANESPGTQDVRWHADNASSGVYYFRLTAGTYEEIRKMLLVK